MNNFKSKHNNRILSKFIKFIKKYKIIRKITLYTTLIKAYENKTEGHKPKKQWFK